MDSGLALPPSLVELRRTGRAPRNDGAKQKSRSFDRALRFSNRRALSGSLVRHGCVVTVGVCVGLVTFTVSLSAGFGLGTAARALGELALDFLDRFGFRRMLDHGDFARQAIE